MEKSVIDLPLQQRDALFKSAFEKLLAKLGDSESPRKGALTYLTLYKKVIKQQPKRNKKRSRNYIHSYRRTKMQVSNFWKFVL